MTATSEHVHPAVEAVARAICKVIFGGKDAFWESCLPDARAAINALADWVGREGYDVLATVVREFAAEPRAEDDEVERLRREVDHWKKTACRRGGDLNRALAQSTKLSERALTVRRVVAGMVRAEADEWQVKGEDYRRFPAEVSAERAWTARAEDLRRLANRIEAES